MKLLRKRRVDKAFVEQTEVPKRYDPSTKTWIDTSGYIYNKNTGLWEEKWNACPINGIYLYNKGNECTDVTGGWTINGVHPGAGYVCSNKSQYLYKNSDNMQIYMHGSWVDAQASTTYTKKAIDLTDYSTLKVMAFGSKAGGSIKISTGVPWYNSRMGWYQMNVGFLKSVSIDAGTAYQLHELDVSDVTGEYYIHLYGDQARSQYNLNVYISQVWLEKEEETEQVDVSDERT